MAGRNASMSRFVIVTRAGRAINCTDGHCYWKILEEIYQEYQCAGVNWDMPNMLLLDGKVVVASGLDDLAWNYGRAKSERVQKTVAQLRTELTPEFLKEEGA
jgi:hypothetical protein